MNNKKNIQTKSSLSWQKKVIAGCRKNDRRCQEEVYRHFFPVMERMVLRYTRDEDQLFDIINDGFLKVFKNIGSFEERGSFEGWIRRIVFNSLSNYFRRSARDVKFLLFDPDKNDPPIQPSTQLYYDDLMKLVGQLPEIQMKVFHLHAIEGYSHKEISQQLEINENTSRWYLAEARKELKSKVSKLYSTKFYETG